MMGFVSKRGRGHRDVLEDLEAEGKSLEAVWAAWSIVEIFSSDSLRWILLELSGKKPDADWVNRLNASVKIRLLHDMGQLSDTEFKTIWDFRGRRNELAHAHGISFHAYTEKEKEGLVEMAIVAVDAIYALSDRLAKRRGS